MTYEEFKSEYGLTNLNEQQEAAIQRVDGATLLLATPGSGKTTVLVARIGYMIRVCNIWPGSILALTYTKAAAKEMAERFNKKYGDGLPQKPTFSTINSFCCSVLYKCQREKGIVLPTLQPQNERIIREIAAGMCEDYPKDAQVKFLQQMIGKAKNEMMNRMQMAAVDTGSEINFPDFFEKYQSTMNEKGWMDFDDQLILAYRYLQEFPDILNRAKNMYRYVSLDEAQDTSLIQHRIVELLVGRTGNIFMVGDEDQSIYGFRGAYPEALLKFEGNYDNATQLYMETNYRSGGVIVDAANQFIQRNHMRFAKHMQACDTKPAKIIVTPSQTMQEQQEVLMARVGDYLNRPDETLAILGRNNESILPMAHKLVKVGIPVNVKDITSTFFGSFVVADLLNFLAFSLDTTNGTLFAHLSHKMGLYLTKDKVKQILTDSETKPECSLLELAALYVNGTRTTQMLTRIQVAMEKASKETPTQAIQTLLETGGYVENVMEKKVDGQNSEQSMMMKANTLRLMAEEYQSIPEFLAAMTQLKQLQTTSGSNITLSTIHGSKGMEFDHVIMVDALKKVFPQEYVDMTQNEVEEEARLFYVGMTRAKSELEFAYFSRFYGQKFDPSEFLNAFITKQNATEHATKAAERDRGENPSKINRGYTRPAKRRTVESSDVVKLSGQWIRHRSFGEGYVKSVSGMGVAEIEFITTGRKKLMLGQCIQDGLIELVAKS